MALVSRMEGFIEVGHVKCALDAVARGQAQLERLRAQTVVGTKPIAIQETGVSGYIGGFTTWVDSNTPISNRPFYLQEMGRYLGAMVYRLAGLPVNRVTAFSLYSNYETGDTVYGGEAGYSLMRRQPSIGNNLVFYPASLLWFGKAVGYTYASNDPPGANDWDVVGDEQVVAPF